MSWRKTANGRLNKSRISLTGSKILGVVSLIRSCRSGRFKFHHLPPPPIHPPTTTDRSTHLLATLAIFLLLARTTLSTINTRLADILWLPSPALATDIALAGAAVSTVGAGRTEALGSVGHAGFAEAVVQASVCRVVESCHFFFWLKEFRGGSCWLFVRWVVDLC